MIDDFKAAIKIFKKPNLPKHHPKIVEGIDIRIQLRQAVFNQTFGLSLFFIPFLLYLTFSWAYPYLDTWWDWKYWLYFMEFSVLLYLTTAWMAPRIKRAKSFYLWQTIFLSFPWLILDGFGQWLAYMVIPSKDVYWYFLMYVPILIYSPFLFIKQMKDLRQKMTSLAVIGNLDHKPIWDDHKYLYDRYNPRHNRWINSNISTLTMLLFTILLFVSAATQFFPSFILGVFNALVLLAVIEASYRSILIHYYLSQIEKYIEKPISLDKYPK